jgi:uncharacterized protein YdcH (DUF465 family)
MSNEIKPKDKISILLAYIFEEGINKYKDNFEKLILRLNEFYDTNKVDIINYFTKVIMYLPTQTTIYSNCLYFYSKDDITNGIFTKLIEELNKTKNGFIYIRVFIFLFGLIHFNVIPNQYLNDFIQECISKKNGNILYLLIISIFLIYRKDNDYQFLSQNISTIYESNIIPQNDIILKTLYIYSINNDENMVKDENNFNGFFIKDIKKEENNTNNSLNVNNIFAELIKINYDGMVLPKLKSREFSDNNKEITFNDIYYELLIMNNMEAFKDEPYKGANNYLFSLPELYYNIDNKEKNNNINPCQFIIDNFAYASLDLILLPILTKSDVSFIIYFILYVLKERKAHFKLLTNDNKEKNIYITTINNLISNENFISSLSPFQLDNLITFLYYLMSNIPYAQNDILANIQKLNSNTNNNDLNMVTNDTLLYFINSFYEKISNLIHKDSVPVDAYFPEKNQKPNIIDSITHLSYFKDIFTNINVKKSFNYFDKTIFENDKQNEVLYTFIYCILNSRNNSLNTLYDLIDFYSSAIREIIGGDTNNNNMENTSDTNDKQKIILKVIFDVYGHSPLHFIYIIDLLAFKNLLNHITVINFIFTEKLFQKKENGLIYSYYTIINNSIENCYTMLNKFDNDFQNLAKSFSKVDEEKRKELQQKMEFYDNEVSKLKKQKDIICDEVLGQFIKLYEISEGLGGPEYTNFIQKYIEDEILLFKSKYNVSEELVDKARKLFK